MQIRCLQCLSISGCFSCFFLRFRSVATISVVILCVYSFEFCALWFSNLLSQESTHFVGHDGLFSLRVLCAALILNVWLK